MAIYWEKKLLDRWIDRSAGVELEFGFLKILLNYFSHQ